MRKFSIGRRARRVGAVALATSALGAGVLLGVTSLANASTRPHTSSTAAGVYLETTGPSIAGPSTGRPGAQDVLSYSWGAQSKYTISSSVQSGKATEAPLSIQIYASKVSPRFLTMVGNGSKFTTLSLIVTSTSQDFLYDSETFELSDAHVISISMGGAVGGGGTVESLTFAYRAIKETFQPVGNGVLLTPVTSSWNFALNSTTFP
jgi:type VI protein secretion system component Hcp